MEPIDVEMFCRWEEWNFDEDANIIVICHHPLKQGVCDYCNPLLELFDYEECIHFQKSADTPSQVEEEVRQYMEYTED